MGIREERNIATLLRWNHDVWGLGRTELAPEILASAYVRHDPSGVRVWTSEEYAAEVASRGGPRIRSDEVIARGDFVGLRWSLLDPPADAPFMGGLQVYEFDAEHRMRAMWGGVRNTPAGEWPDAGEPSRWLIAADGAMTDEERRNERTLQSALNGRLANDPTGLDGFYVDPLPSHTPRFDRSESTSDFAKRIANEGRLFPRKRFVEHARLLVGDRSVLVWGWRWDDSDGPELNGIRYRSPWEFVEIWRYEDGRIAERWQVAAPPGASWTEDNGQPAT